MWLVILDHFSHGADPSSLVAPQPLAPVTIFVYHIVVVFVNCR